MRICQCLWPLLSLLAVSLLAHDVSAQGIVLPGVGTVNRSMGGASVAAPIDAAGTLHWNPGALSGLASSEFVVSAELLGITSELSSSVFGVGSGSTGTDSEVFALPTVAIAFRPEDSCFSYGLGMYSIGGFGFNYPTSGTNPILFPPAGPPLAGVGVGPVYSKLSILQIAPTVAMQVTDKLSIGLAPTLSMADAALDPGILASPVGGVYPPATHGRIFWGIGFQAGVYYVTDSCWTLGASFKSPQWFEEFQFNWTGGTARLKADFPMILSVGAAYHGIERLVWAVDVRYVDYDNTDGFGDATGFAPDGRVTGLGWQSVFAVATGVQYELTDRLTLRLGYSYNENPIRDSDTFFNVASPAIYEHVISVGTSLWLSDRTTLSLAYLHAFENSISGPFQSPAGPVAGTSVMSEVSVNALVCGLEVRF